MTRAERAVVMAAGLGSRLWPLTAATPKPLVEVAGRPMIETMLDGFAENGYREVRIVVGHLAGRFGYLEKKYAPMVSLVRNPRYREHNNISSLYCARECLQGAVICDGDLVLSDPSALDPRFEHSGYLSAWADETGEWLQTVDENDFVTSTSAQGGKRGWQLHSVSFWTEADGARLGAHLEELYPVHSDIFWDCIPHFLRKNEYRLKIRRMSIGAIAEIDTLDDLKSYELSQKNKSLAKI